MKERYLFHNYLLNTCSLKTSLFQIRLHPCSSSFINVYWWQVLRSSQFTAGIVVNTGKERTWVSSWLDEMFPLEDWIVFPSDVRTKVRPLYLWRKVPVMLPSSSVREGKMGALFSQLRSPLQVSSKLQGLHSLGLTAHGTALFSLGDASESSRTVTGIVTIYLACARLC